MELGSPVAELAAVTNAVPNVCRKITPKMAIATTAAVPARAMTFAVRVECAWRSSPEYAALMKG
jgi:hypothetical protein